MADRRNIKVEPMVVYWGSDVMQVQTITTRADVALNLQNDYFFLYDSAGVKHYFWFNVATLGVDPAPAGATGHAVAISTGDTAAAVATALELVIEATTGFDSAASGAVVTVTHTVAGYTQAAHEGVGTLFSFSVSTQGDSETEAGFTDGNIEMTTEPQNVDVTAHQRGTEVLSHIRTGTNVEAAITFKETTVAQLRRVFLHHGGEFTPSGASGTQLVGWGSSKQFLNTIDQAKKLRLHPKVLATSDRSRDVTFWLAYPNPESLAFSGEEILMQPVTFAVYEDDTKPAAINKFAIGDSSQTLS